MAGTNPYPGSDIGIYNQPDNGYNTGPAPSNMGKTSDGEVSYNPGSSSRNGTVVYDSAGNPHYANVDRYGNVLLIDGKPPGTYNQPSSHGRIAIPYGGGSGGITQYEQQQIALDKRRLADAEAQQRAAQQLAESQAVEGFNKDYRDFQAKSFYGSQYGPTYFSPAGAVFAQRAPESATLKQAFKDAGQADPWQQQGNVPAGYTGTTYANPQHPGLVDWGHPSVQNAPQQPDQSQAVPVSDNPWGNVNPGPSGLNVRPPMPPMQQGPSQEQFQQWHDLAHQLPQPSTQPVQMGGQVAQLPSFDQGGVVPGSTGSPQVILAHGGEEVVPNGQSSSSPWGTFGAGDMSSWHETAHQQPGPWEPFIGHSGGGTHWSPWIGGGGGGLPAPQSHSNINAYGQTVGSNMMHGATEDVVPSPLGYSPESQKYLNNHVQYGPELSGMSGLGGLITPNGTPVVMSAWQRSQFDPTSIANYGDYAHAIAGWNPDDLTHAGQNMTGNVGDLTRPSNWTPIGIQPSPSGG